MKGKISFMTVNDYPVLSCSVPFNFSKTEILFILAPCQKDSVNFLLTVTLKVSGQVYGVASVGPTVVKVSKSRRK
jgi:hypothetical protein